MRASASASGREPGDLRDLFPIPGDAVSQYESARPQVVARVDAALYRRPDLGVLLGDAPSAAVRELHRYLGAFLGSVLALGIPEMLPAGLPGLLGGYRSRGLTEDYFNVLPELWSQALEEQMGPRAQPLTRVWRWLEAHPQEWVPRRSGGETSGADSEAVDRLLKALLSGDMPAARSAVRSAQTGGATVERVFVDLVQPALYEIGKRWETGRITAAQEHLASALVARLLASLDEAFPGGDERLAVVTTAPTETHAFGAWMVADVLRSAGWSVRFLGSQLPVDDILHYLRLAQPRLLAVSVTLEIHLPSLRELTRGLRDDDLLADLPVLVGGQAFRAGERVWRTAGADGIALDALDVVRAAEELLASRPGIPEAH